MDQLLNKKTLWEIFKDSVYTNKDRIAVKYLKQSYTYEEYFKDICNIACKISNELKIDDKCKIIIYSDNSYLYACYIMACIQLGVTIIPLSIKMDSRDFEKIVADIQPQCIYTDLKWMIDNDTVRLLEKAELVSLQERNNPTNSNAKVQFILFSSGSTGEIKGIECTQSGIISATMAINEIIDNNSEDNILCMLDFSFDYGLYQLFLAYEVGATITIFSSNDNILRIPDYIYQNSVTGFPATPFLLKILKETRKVDGKKLSSLKYISSTGDYLSSEIVDFYRNIYPQLKVFPMYGLTECKRVSILSPEDYESHKNSVGKPISCCKVKIIKEDGTQAKYKEEGELVVTGSNIMKGYYMDQKLTSEKFVKRDDGIVELHTGDIFTMDEEGFLYFVSRTQNYIKIRDKRVSPLSIEREIMDKVEEVNECLVVPLRVMSKVDSIFCFIRLNEGCSIDSTIRKITSRLTRLYVPEYFYEYKDMFLHNINGKIDRKKMAEVAKELFDMGSYLEL